MKKIFRTLLSVVTMTSVIAASVCSANATTLNWNLYHTGTAYGNHTYTSYSNINCNNYVEVGLSSGSSITPSSATVSGSVTSSGTTIMVYTLGASTTKKGTPAKFSNGKATFNFQSGGSAGSAYGYLNYS